MFRVLLGIAAAGFCAAQTIQEFPTSNFAPYGIAAGSDGALWFTPSSVSPVRTALGRMTTAGTFTQHALPAGFSASNSPIVAAPDGNLWFQISNGSTNAIARMTTAGTVTQFAANSFVAPVHSMTVGPDGAIWMTESTTRIGRITTSGSYSFHSVGGFNPFGIVAGSDGNLWFTAVATSGGSYIGQLTLNGLVETEAISGTLDQSSVNPITSGPDGSLWFMIDPGSGSGSVGRITTAGSFGSVNIPPSNSYSFRAASIAPGPDGRLWFSGNNALGEVTTTGTVTVQGFQAATAGEGIIEGSDGAMWSGDALNNQVLRATTSGGSSGGGGSGTLGVSPSSVSFAAPFGRLPAAQSVQVTSTSGTISYGVGINYTSAAPANWLCLSSTTSSCPSSLGGSASPGNPGTVPISISTAGLSFPPGTYTATVNVTDNTSDPPVAITYTVGAINVQTSMVFGALTGSPGPGVAQDPQELVVGAYNAAVSYTYSIQPSVTSQAPPQGCAATASDSTPTNVPWLLVNGSTATSGSGTTSQNLMISVQPAGLAPGTYVDYLNLVQGASTTPIEIYLVVLNSSGTFSFSYTPGGTAPVAQTTPNLGSACGVAAVNILAGYASDQNWLSAVLNGAGSGFTVTMNATPTGLSAGTYYGAVAVTDLSGEVLELLATLTVAGPSKTATTTQLSASPNPANTGQAVTLTATVSPSAAAGSVTFFDGANSLGSGTLSAGTATLSTKFAAGNHTLTATYSGNTTYATSTSTPVNLQVTAGLTATSTSLTAQPVSQVFGSPVNLTATVTPSTATGTVTFFDGTTQVGAINLTNGAATLSISTLAVGSHTLTASYGGDAGDASSNSPPTGVNITSSNQPAILAGGIVNAASYAQANGAGSPVAPGSLVAIFTSPLAAQPANFTTATLPPSLGNVSVTFKGITAPMVQVAPAGAFPFVSVQVPFEVLTAGQTSATVPVVITVNGIPSAAVQTQIVASQPGIFTLTANGLGQAVLVNLADYTIAAPAGTSAGSHPIPRGQSAFFYVTGLGALTPSVTNGSGTCPASSGLCNANQMPTVFVGGVQANVVFAGQAPGFPGVSQINISIPPNAPSGSSVSLVVRSGDGTVTSNSATIAVQ